MRRSVIVLWFFALSSGAAFGQAVRIGGEEPTKGEFVFVGTVVSAVAEVASMSEPPRWQFLTHFKDLEMIKGARPDRMVLNFTTRDDKAKVLQAGARVVVKARDGRVESIVEATDEAVRAAGGRPAAAPAGTAPAATRDWSRFLGPNADGISPETGINKDWNNRPPRVLWDIPLDDQGHAGPSVAGGTVYIVDRRDETKENVVRAIDIRDGKDLWTFAYPEPQAPDHGYTRATPLVEEGKVYTVSRFGLVHCLDARSGRMLWSRDIVKDFDGEPPTWQISMSPVVDGEKIIVCPGGKDGAVAALNKKTGETVWRGGGSHAGKSGLGYATPVIATLCGKKQYVVFMGTCLIGVDAENGRELWKLPWMAIQNTATPLVTGEDTVFITTWYEQKKACALVKVSSDGTRVVWENANIMSKMATPVLFKGHIYGNNSGAGSLVCIDAKTGDLRWSQEGFEHGGLVAVDGVLLALDGRSGDLIMVEMTPDGYRELGRAQPLKYQGKGLRGCVWTAPIVADGKVVARDRNKLVCLDLR